MANLVIKLVKSSAGEKPAIRDSVRSLGLKKVGDEVKHADSPSIRGMARAARHLVTVEEVK
ncbi:50S ribosomal protein L30 [Propionimicrobium lymphophilum]|uniref:50S ribosomal protein L30 n=1 Tax=Propionimicrobium lymphophilum TaxID=33012 RepID=UPI00041DF045|nr:50S ribosomal protein L30 [Propionimicrobium lymphophilum]